MPTCTNDACRGPLPMGARFCPRCGASVALGKLAGPPDRPWPGPIIVLAMVAFGLAVAFLILIVGLLRTRRVASAPVAPLAAVPVPTLPLARGTSTSVPVVTLGPGMEQDWRIVRLNAGPLPGASSLACVLSLTLELVPSADARGWLGRSRTLTLSPADEGRDGGGKTLSCGMAGPGANRQTTVTCAVPKELGTGPLVMEYKYAE